MGYIAPKSTKFRTTYKAQWKRVGGLGPTQTARWWCPEPRKIFHTCKLLHSSNYR